MALARSAANQSPEAREALTGVAQERFAGQSPRAAAVHPRADGWCRRDRRCGNPAGGGAQGECRQLPGGVCATALARYLGQIGISRRQPRRAAGGQKRRTEAARTAPSPRAIRCFTAGRPCSTGITPTETCGTPPTRPSAPAAAAKAPRSSRCRCNCGTSSTPSCRATRRARQGAAAAFGAEDALEAGQKFVTAKGQNADVSPRPRQNEAAGAGIVRPRLRQ